MRGPCAIRTSCAPSSCWVKRSSRPCTRCSCPSPTSRRSSPGDPEEDHRLLTQTRPAVAALQAPEEVDHGGIDCLGPLLLRPMTAAGEHDRLPEVRDELHQVGNELVHTAEGDHQVPVTGDIERRDGHARPGKGREDLTVTVDIAVPVQTPAKAGAREFHGEEIDVGCAEPWRQGRRLHQAAEEAAAPWHHADGVSMAHGYGATGHIP